MLPRAVEELQWLCIAVAIQPSMNLQVYEMLSSRNMLVLICFHLQALIFLSLFVISQHG